MANSSRAPYYLLAGLAWGAIAGLLGGKAIGPSIGAGLIAAPFIGILVGRTTQPRFEALAGWRRSLIPPCSVYCGATLFGLAIGIGDLIAGRGDRALEVLWTPVLGVWYGTTLFLIALWPLAYFTHVALAASRDMS